jgi:hypothetical protein
MYSSFKLEKVSEGVLWGTREQGTLNEQIVTACKKPGEALAKAAIEKEAKVPTD